MISDAARRLHDVYNLHREADFHGTLGHWFAVRLTDGTEDHPGTIYGSKVAAMRDQKLDEKYYAFVKLGPHPMNLEEAETYLKMHRRMYEKGLRLGDTDKPYELIPRLNRDDQYSQLRALFRGGKPSNLILPN